MKQGVSCFYGEQVGWYIMGGIYKYRKYIWLVDYLFSKVAII